MSLAMTTALVSSTTPVFAIEKLPASSAEAWNNVDKLNQSIMDGEQIKILILKKIKIQD